MEEGLALIEAACAPPSDRPSAAPLRVQCTIGFATCFLLARLPGFAERHPEIAVDLVTRDQNEVLEDGMTDVAVTFGEAGLPAAARMVFRETIFPVCAPGHLPPDRMPGPDELAGERLLIHTAPGHAEAWARLLGPAQARAALRPAPARYNSFALYLKAVMDGHGIGIGWGCLMDDLLAAGTLRIAGTPCRVTERGY